MNIGIGNLIEVKKTTVDLPRSICKISKLEWSNTFLDIKGICKIKGYYELANVKLIKKIVIKESLNTQKDEIIILQNTEDDYFYNKQESCLEVNFKVILDWYKYINKKIPTEDTFFTCYINVSIINDENDTYEYLIPFGNFMDEVGDNFNCTSIEHFENNLYVQYNIESQYDMEKDTIRIECKVVKKYNPSAIYSDVKNKTLKSSRIKNFINTLLRTKIFRGIFYILKLLFKVKSDRVLFLSDSRKDIGGNMEFVYKEMLNQNIDVEYKFIFKESNLVKKNLKEIIQIAYYVATSRIIFLEELYQMISPLKLSKETELIQLWHASGVFKNFGSARKGKKGGISIVSKAHSNVTKVIVSSKNIVKEYADSFNLPIERIIPLGTPRTDIFFDEQYMENKQNELYLQYPFLKSKKVILFAPTFRGSGRKEAHYPLNYLEYGKLYESLKDDYVFIFKLHFNVINKVSIPYKYSEFFHDLTEYRDINDLLLISDILITDYSSTCFDFSLLNKPMLFFAYDLEEYVSTRGFYYDYEDFVPGSIVKNTKEIIEKIILQEFKTEKINSFRGYFLDELQGGSSKKVVEQLVKPILYEK